MLVGLTGRFPRARLLSIAWLREAACPALFAHQHCSCNRLCTSIDIYHFFFFFNNCTCKEVISYIQPRPAISRSDSVLGHGDCRAGTAVLVEVSAEGWWDVFIPRCALSSLWPKCDLCGTVPGDACMRRSVPRGEVSLRVSLAPFLLSGHFCHEMTGEPSADSECWWYVLNVVVFPKGFWRPFSEKC